MSISSFSGIDDRRQNPVGHETFVDFDHTLLAANSTELFIGFCRPSFFAAIIDFVVRGCLPWRLLPASIRYRMRDYLCCALLMVLMPWNMGRWKREAPGIFAANRCPFVDRLIEDSPHIVIVSFGSRAVIKPLLFGSTWERAVLMATPARCGPAYFRKGKLAMVSSSYDQKTIAEARFITDSEEDRDLLDAVRDGIKIPMQGERNSAAEKLYMPLRYTFGIKFPRIYSIDQFFLTDILLGALAAATGFGELLSLLPVIFLLSLSVMCIYEVGYYENDFVGIAVEAAPTLTAKSARYQEYPIHVNAWIWAAAAGALGIYLANELDLLAYGFYASAAIWVTVLLAIRLTFYGYNRLKPDARIGWYVVLQIEKSALMFLLIFPTVVGMVMVASHIAAMWMVYIIYRIAKVKDKISREWLRFGLFGLIIGCLALAAPAVLQEEKISIGLICVWSLLRCVKAPLMRQLRAFRQR